MSTNDHPLLPVHPNDPAFHWLTSPAPPRDTVRPADIEEARNQLKAAAKLATDPDATSERRRWVPGLSIVVVIRTGEETCHVEYSHAGFAALDDMAGIDEHTLFPCASVSKPVSTSLLALALQANPDITDKQKWWDLPVKRHGKDVAFKKAPGTVTLRQWLSHRSGMPDHGGDLTEDMTTLTGGDIVNHVLDYQTGFEAGKFRYTNFGFTAGCFGAGDGFGQSIWPMFAEKWMPAIGMTESTYLFSTAFTQPRTNRVVPHIGKPETPKLLSTDPTGWAWRVADKSRERDPQRQAPAGSLLSNAKDLGAFLTAHLITKDRKFVADFPPKDPPASDTADNKSYSLGWNVVKNDDHSYDGKVNQYSFNHSGAFALGAATFLRFDPDAGIGIAILSNGEPTGVPEALGQIFFKYAYGDPMPTGCDQKTVLALTRMLMMSQMYPLKIANHTRYHGKAVTLQRPIPDGEVFRGHSDYYSSDIVITCTRGNLFLTMGPSFPTFPLQCMSRDGTLFAYDTFGENEVGPSGIHLEWNDNTVVQITDDWLNGIGPDEPATGLGVITQKSKA